MYEVELDRGQRHSTYIWVVLSDALAICSHPKCQLCRVWLVACVRAAGCTLDAKGRCGTSKSYFSQYLTPTVIRRWLFFHSCGTALFTPADILTDWI